MTMATGRAIPPMKKTGSLPAPQKKKPLLKSPASRVSPATGLSGSRPVAAPSVHPILLSARRELELARKMRSDAQRYLLETTAKANSQAQQLLLHARLATQKEIDEVVSKATAEIQKMLADIRVIRITAQEELSAQKKFTDAARIASLSFNVDRDAPAPVSAEPKKKPVIIKQ